MSKTPVINKQLDNIAEAIWNVAGGGINQKSLDATFGAMLNGENTTDIFWQWWPLSETANNTKYDRLCRFATMAANAWKDKVYTLRSYNANVSGLTTMTPLADLAGKEPAQLCTETTEPVKDWADEDPMTWYIRAQALSLQDGTMDITYLEGEEGFDITGEDAPVYTFALSLWINDYTDGQYDYVTFATVQKPGLYPMPGDVGLDNKKRAITWHSTFPGSLNSKGALTSGAGRAPYNFVNAAVGIAAARKMTPYEGLWNDCDSRWLLYMWQLRHFDLENSNILEGCLNYNYQDMAAKAETGVRRVLLASGAGAKYVVGSNVAVGNMGDDASANKDRGQAHTRNLVANAQISSIENVIIDGAAYDALNLILDETIDVPAVAMVSTMPYFSGDTEALPGHKDGCRVSLTGGKTPLRVAGVEAMDGAYTIGLDPLYNVTKVTPEEGSDVYQYTVHECRDSENLAGSITANYIDTGISNGDAVGWTSGWKYVKSFVRNKLGILFPDQIGGASNTYYKSAFDVTNSAGVRCPWRFMLLYNGGHGGLAGGDGYHAPSSSGWAGRPRLSGAGKKRGEWQ